MKSSGRSRSRRPREPTMIVREDQFGPARRRAVFRRATARRCCERRRTRLLELLPVSQREALIEILARSGKDEDRLARAPRTDLMRHSRGNQGAGLRGHLADPASGRGDQRERAGPFGRSRYCACLTTRFAASAIPQRTGIERFLPKLRQCAARISASFLGTTSRGAPQAGRRGNGCLRIFQCRRSWFVSSASSTTTCACA